MATRGKLNFVIAEAVESALTAYSADTGRSSSDVVRQLLGDWLDAEMPMAPALVHPAGKRTNVPLSYAALDKLDAKLTAQGHKSVAALVGVLLAEFLAARGFIPGAHTATERVLLSLLVPAKLFGALIKRHGSRDKVERAILQASRRISPRPSPPSRQSSGGSDGKRDR